MLFIYSKSTNIIVGYERFNSEGASENTIEIDTDDPSKYVGKYKVDNGEPVPTTEYVKERKYSEIKKAFDSYVDKDGSMYSEVLGADINARDKDVNILEKLVELMEKHGEIETEFRLHDNSFTTATKDQVQAVIEELKENGMAIREKRWNLEAQIEAATTVEEVESISW